VLAAGEEEIAAARGHLRRLGAASVHKAGVLAAAGLIAWERMRARVGDDHRRARRLADALAAAGLAGSGPETNIVLLDAGRPAEETLAALADAGVLAFSPDGKRVRLVAHRGIGDRDIAAAAAAIAGAL